MLWNASASGLDRLDHRRMSHAAPDHAAPDHSAQRAHLRERIAVFARGLPADALIAQEAAAVVHGLATYRVPPIIDTTRTRGRGQVTSDLRISRAGLRASDYDCVDGIPVTSLARTVVDIARRRPFREGLVVADSALARGLGKAQLHDVLRHQWTWPYVARAMPVVRYADGRAESALESVVRSRFIELDLPLPRLQVTIRAGRTFVGRVDFDWDAWGVVGEADGRVKYLADELWAEKVRQDALEDTGREVIRWTWTTAHAPDAEFRARLLRKFRRAALLRDANRLPGYP
jgi:hypothetical protein